jgi:hypothetical protein
MKYAIVEIVFSLVIIALLHLAVSRGRRLRSMQVMLIIIVGAGLASFMLHCIALSLKGA